MLKDNQKFFAFVLLILAVLTLGGISILVDAMTKDGQQTDPTVLQAKLTILNIAMGGLIGAVGAASQAFFRSSQTDQDTAAAMKSMAESLPAVPALSNGGTTTTTTTVEPAPAAATAAPQEVVVVNEPDAPVPTTQETKP